MRILAFAPVQVERRRRAVEDARLRCVDVGLWMQDRLRGGTSGPRLGG
jgi:hypothetical protein